MNIAFLIIRFFLVQKYRMITTETFFFKSPHLVKLAPPACRTGEISQGAIW